MDNALGTSERIGGYRVVRRLAIGGTSEVLLAKAEGPQGFERNVVLKLLLSQYTHDAEFKSMFAREAAAYARLSHPAIVRLYDFLSHGDRLVMVLEYIDGPPLSKLRGMLRAVGQQIDDSTAFHISACIFDALAAAHAANDDSGEPAPVIHRDCNPSNVLVPWDGQVKLADFGIAKVTGVNHQSSAGLIKGTYGYMAPEQITGETPVTPRADVYAGAIILWEMLTKRRAFIRGALPEIEVLRALAEPRIVSIDVLRPDLDKSVRDALKRALQPRAEKRTMTAEEMVSILRAVVSPDQGRETLAKALASVRHEPHSSQTSMPPAEPANAPDPSPVARPARPLPKPTPAPLPAVLSRDTAAYAAKLPVPTTTSQGLGPPRPRTRSQEAMAATMVSPAEPGSKPGSKPGSSPPVSGPASEPGLAALLEPSSGPAASTDERRLGLSVFDSLVEPRELVQATGRESEKMRLESPLRGGPGGSMHDAIDEILRDLPSNLPPGVLPGSEPPRELGHLPAAPPPLEVSPPKLAPPQTSEPPVMNATATGPFGSAFPELNRTFAMMERPRPPTDDEIANAEMMTARPPPEPALGSTPPSTLPLGGMTTQALPTAPISAPSAGTLMMASPPQAQVFAAGLAPGSVPPANMSPSSSSGPQAAVPTESVRPIAMTGPPVIMIVIVIVLVLVAGAGGTVAYLKWPRARSGTGTGTTSPSAGTAPSVVPSVVPSITPSAAPSAVPSAAPSAVPSAVPSTAPSAVPSVTPSAAPVASAVGDVPAGMGRIKTEGAAPGRRIFVDERVVGQTPEAVVVKCGSRAVKIGSAGFTHRVDVPCAGEITVGDR